MCSWQSCRSLVVHFLVPRTTDSFATHSHIHNHAHRKLKVFHWKLLEPERILKNLNDWSTQKLFDMSKLIIISESSGNTQRRTWDLSQVVCLNVHLRLPLYKLTTTLSVMHHSVSRLNFLMNFTSLFIPSPYHCHLISFITSSSLSSSLSPSITPCFFHSRLKTHLFA